MLPCLSCVSCWTCGVRRRGRALYIRSHQSGRAREGRRREMARAAGRGWAARFSRGLHTCVLVSFSGSSSLAFIAVFVCYRGLRVLRAPPSLSLCLSLRILLCLPLIHRSWCSLSSPLSPLPSSASHSDLHRSLAASNSRAHIRIHAAEGGTSSSKSPTERIVRPPLTPTGA